MKKWKHSLLVSAFAAPAFAQQDADVAIAIEKARSAIEQTRQSLTIDKFAADKFAAEGAALQAAQAKLAQVDMQALAERQLEMQVLKDRIENVGPLAPLHPERVPGNFAFAPALALPPAAVFQIRSGNGSYDGGTRALDDHRYEDAIRHFDAVINTRSTRADGALYWKAYALDKAGRKDEAVAAIAKLRQDYPQSRWLNDAQALESALKQGSGQPASAAAETNEDLKLMAINSLMSGDPERAVPLLEGVLKGNSAPRVKERALFVLTQSKAPRATQLLSEYAKGAGNPDMQMRAIRYLGMSATPDSQQQLVSIYSSSNDSGTKREIIRSLMMSKGTDQVFNLAKSEKDPELRIEAIRQLGGMRATPQLMQLYASESSTDKKVSIVRSLMSAGAGDKILELAKNEKDPRVRTEALRSLAHTNSVPSDALMQLYASETDLKNRRELVNGLASRGEVKTLVELARKESDPATKKMIVERISTSHSKEATDYMMELLK
jgi:tetratricopeptide (TPR) repeat protein